MEIVADDLTGPEIAALLTRSTAPDSQGDLRGVARPGLVATTAWLPADR
jgi:hypothetical protein